MEQVLAKSDMGIAGHYAGLVEDDALREHVFNRIRDGWRATHDGLLEITGKARLLEKDPSLETSLRLRLYYNETFKLLRIELGWRNREGEETRRRGVGTQRLPGCRAE